MTATRTRTCSPATVPVTEVRTAPPLPGDVEALLRRLTRLRTSGISAATYASVMDAATAAQIPREVTAFLTVNTSRR